MIRRSLIFIAVFALMQLGWQLGEGRGWERIYLEKMVAAPAAFAINRFTPDFSAAADGARINSPQGGINIVNGCDGTEMLFLLLAGFAVAHLSLRARTLGVLAGVPFVWVLNQIRIVALFYANQSHRDLFDVLHGFVAPGVMVLLIAAYFYIWLQRATVSDPA